MARVLDMLARAALWRPGFIPALSLRLWTVLWGANLAVIVADVVGRSAGWWTTDWDLTLATLTVNGLLCFTPLEIGHWFARRRGTDGELVFITRKQAKILMTDPDRDFEVHRLVTCRGKFVSGRQVF